MNVQNERWNRYMDELAMRVAKTVTHVTPENPPMADTSSNGRQYRPPMEETEMFRTDRTDYIVLAALAFALVSTLFS